MDTVRDIETVLAQLRHAYAHLKNGTVGDVQAFADGLIAPQIRRLEKIHDDVYHQFQKAGQ